MSLPWWTPPKDEGSPDGPTLEELDRQQRFADTVGAVLTFPILVVGTCLYLWLLP